ncbi:MULTISPECIES: primary-amine oxidase [Streptomycetaceae]|uniref:Amine oxidase n=1 Tax=Streptantibioticus cattleyicolor (strain ATCC 35852 / DSM 46488 / JCM 4925 / NBRC 14057 / NRRL 8057) TaxID=1003195 RepID=F8K0K8_STREN|nr:MULTISPECIES: primary-amine oxidase [Streptomycetaceae]AEW97414.1 tyramine oxidase [Streptantibioticus cattleyicolor NRRL 8057 = DSM 46488]MYS61858.1 primary-amine oxidase [Streptomyces sp. SID5468]CCB77737.1 Histamine oxidase [Streptantibioticus cattleyicolor NRRL 8057 = DSM 46488]
MTDCCHPRPQAGPHTAAARPAPHPLDPLTAEEITAARRVLAEAGKVTDDTRFPLVLLDEPDRHAVTAHRDGDPVPRRLRVTLLDAATGAAAEALVDVTASVLLSHRDLDPAAEGQPPLTFEEYDIVEAVVKADPGWRKAMADRGVADPGLAMCAPLAAGCADPAAPPGHRVLRSLTWMRCSATDNPWSHPVGGLVADVDLIERRVIRLIDTGAVPLPPRCDRYEPEFNGPPRTDLEPLEIRQPDGPSFHLDGNQLTWQGWHLRIDFNAREGLVLHQITLRDGDRRRSVLHRASLAEMAVVYGDPDPVRNWVSFLDAGEYSLGRNANALRLGCDCLGEIRYLDAVLADDHGRPQTLPNAVCVHEEDIGLLWKHTDIFNDMRAESRRARRLVVSFIATVGNYDYAFYWYFHQDGTIAFEAKSTGIVQTSAVEPGTGSPHGTELAPGLLAPYHQHLFCVRLDAAVDGPANTVEEVDVVPLPEGPGNPNGNAFTIRATPITDSAHAGRLADPLAGRRWRITNPASPGRDGQPAAYTLIPQPGPVLLARPGSPVARRMAYATKHLWITRHHPTRRYPAGDYPNQHPGGAGLPRWTTAGEPLDNTQLTLWHTFGPTHLPRPEDWPVMPVDHCGFTLKPTGFFDRNPTLDVPAERGR